MRLTVKYQSGEIRTVNLHPSFFGSCEVSLAKRAVDFAHQHGFNPYRIEVLRGGDLMYEKTYRENNPIQLKSQEKVDEKQIKKDLRNEFKRVPFTVKYIICG